MFYACQRGFQVVGTLDITRLLKISLTPARINDRELIYEWLTGSDLTPSMMGPPDFPENVIPTWEEFIGDYLPHYFDGSNLKAGRCYLIMLEDRSIGQVNYNQIYFDGSTELDIWMSSSEYTGKGYGTESLNFICGKLAKEFDCNEFFIQPSLRNLRAIKSYRKAGFKPCRFPPAWYQADYIDSYLMHKLT